MRKFPIFRQKKIGKIGKYSQDFMYFRKILNVIVRFFNNIIQMSKFTVGKSYEQSSKIDRS